MNLEEIFKPDKYGFCSAPLDNKKNAVWFDTVTTIVSILKDTNYDLGSHNEQL